LKAKVLELGRELFNGDAARIVVPSVDGDLCLLQNHQSIIAALRKGYIKIFRPTVERPISISIVRGICSFSSNSAIFIVETVT
jgi:F0F1-type ATP synthase epsilon subunit